MPSLFLLCLVSFPSRAQSPPAPTGIPGPWGARQILDDLLKDNEKLTPLLNQMNPQEWASKKGASDVYFTQWQVAKQQLNDVITTSRLLSQKTESLPLALDDYFRLEALEVTTRSLQEAVLKYGDRSTADQLSGLIARNFGAREKFRDYIRDLATSQEQNFKAADLEAQRCRGMISREPAAKRTKQ
ncbi:MAG TPA: hypothetical protein VK604_08685 [Bryobacteraceae bacterium]|nr:hypothetical protein [Bryobacteraceae bacterium]